MDTRNTNQRDVVVPIIKTRIHGTIFAVCPNCDRHLIKDNYCSRCGAFLDWTSAIKEKSEQ